MRGAKRFGIDLDGCCVNFNAGYADYFRRRGYDLPTYADAEPPTWHYPEEVHGVDPALVKQFWREEVFTNTTFWRGLPAHPTTSESLWQRLRAMEMNGDEIYFMTTRFGFRPQQQSIAWLKDHAGLKAPQVLLVTGSKGKIAAELKLDVVLDDKPENILDFAHYKEIMRVYHVLRPYNQHVNTPGVPQVVSVLEALDHAEERWKLNDMKEAA